MSAITEAAVATFAPAPRMPFVIVLDLDGTIVGDVTSHLNEWVICKFVTNAMTTFNKNMQWSLQNGLLRPHFTHFVNSVYREHGIELFVYTASTSDWAPVVIRNVEKVIGTKFSRPIFTRDNCLDQNGSLRKSLKSLRPKIFERLRRKYAALRSPDDLAGRMCMIDNTDVINEKWAWIPCPTYDFAPTHDILKHVDQQVLREKYTAIHEELVRQGALPRNVARGGYDAFMAAYYSRMARRLAHNSAKNQRESADVYWKQCAQLLPALIRRYEPRKDAAVHVVKHAVRSLAPLNEAEHGQANV